MQSKALAVLLIEFLVCFLVTYWLIDGSAWLSLLLASALAHCLHLSRKLREQRFLFSIADAELVKVSAAVGRLEEELALVRESMDRLEEQRSWVPHAESA